MTASPVGAEQREVSAVVDRGAVPQAAPSPGAPAGGPSGTSRRVQRAEPAPSSGIASRGSLGGTA